MELQANAAGALQSICFQKDGRGWGSTACLLLPLSAPHA
jgi:hypothetical protein